MTRKSKCLLNANGDFSSFDVTFHKIKLENGEPLYLLSNWGVKLKDDRNDTIEMMKASHVTMAASIRIIEGIKYWTLIYDNNSNFFCANILENQAQ